jgi:hypothetical protein
MTTGWALKAHALVHCRFKQALFLDADNLPVVNPEFLFDTPQFKRTGAVFWPDYHRLAQERTIWQLCGVPWRDQPEFESGQMLVDKSRCWAPLNLALWYNEHAEFFYQHIHGDKDTFHLAFRKLRRPYAMPATPIQSLPGTMCQHDFQGRRIFQHRNGDKWNLFLRNRRVPGFRFEKECREDVKFLRSQWDGGIARHRRAAADTEGPLPPPGPLRILACMISCAERETVRARSLRRWQSTDWGEPPQVTMDPRRFASAVDNLTHTAWLALQTSLQSDAEYVLFLEDDLAFNRHLRHNLEHWAPLRRREVTLASLYNPGVRDWACDVAGHAIVADPQSIIGSQAFLFSRAAVKYVLTHWKDLPAAFDLRAPRLLARLGRPIYYHAPSLVQHVGTRSVWGGGFHRAADFSPAWKARE